MSSGLRSSSSDCHLLQLCFTVAAESDQAKSDAVVESAQPIISLPRRVAVAERSSVDDDQLTRDDNDDDGSPWEIRRNPTADNSPPNLKSTSGRCGGMPLLSGKTCGVESSCCDITRLDKARLSALLQRNVCLDVPLPDRSIADHSYS